jgi:hypothetical protein
MNGSDDRAEWIAKAGKGSLIVGIVAAALCALGAYFDRQQFFRSYLFAYVFWVGIPVGCLGVVMIQHLVGGTWGFIIQRLLESAIRTLPVIALLFLPLFLGMTSIYSWARPDGVTQGAILPRQSLYLNVPAFAVRAVLYFAIWITLGTLLTKWSEEQDRRADPLLTERLKTLSGPGLVLYGLTVTFSSIDWVMSLEPRWFSTIYGMIFMVSEGLVALAFVIATSYFLWNRKPLAQVARPWVLQDLGNMLLAFVMLWAYTSFSQFLLIWVENLQREIPWYLHRLTGGWGAVAIALAAMQFAVPFLLLLSRANKRRAETLCAIALLVVLMHLLELFWLVAPTFYPTGLSLHTLDVLTPVAIGGLWLAAFLGHLRGRSLVPLHDPRFIDVIEEIKEA